MHGLRGLTLILMPLVPDTVFFKFDSFSRVFQFQSCSPRSPECRTVPDSPTRFFVNPALGVTPSIAENRDAARPGYSPPSINAQETVPDVTRLRVVDKPSVLRRECLGDGADRRAGTRIAGP